MGHVYYLKKFWHLYILVGFFAVALAMGTSQAATTMAESIPIERSQTIVIDAGHGGEDGGAVSCTGIKESQINLQIALRLEALLHLMGYRTRMIRTSDVSVYTHGSTLAQKKVSDLKERVRIVSETENALLISIHQNTFPSEQFSGAQVFYNGVAEAKELATHLQNSFVETLNPGSRRVSKPAEQIYLLRQVQCPAVLVECGFLSNYREESKLRSGEYQLALCCVMVSSLCSYLNA
jgi:N-acetylmuramoyl-L-alanine amidase